jgi:hypothetical protein|tara:strand:- start:1834 stop:2433 length:600 start_codon:yes stop_codon:yes gene_type:complete
MSRVDIDRRDYLRMRDSVYIDYRTVPKEQVFAEKRQSPYDVSARFNLLRDMYELELESGQLLRSLTDADRKLGAFLSTVNRRLEMMARILSADELKPRQNPDENVTLSQGGISFQVDELLPVETYLGMKLLFHPSLLGLTMYGKVKYCRLTDEGEHYVAGVEFLQLDSIGEQLLSRHVIRLQAEDRRKRLIDDAYADDD